MQLIKTARGNITTFHGEDAGRAHAHVGIDIGHGASTAADLALIAPEAGIVRVAGWDGTYGNRVIIEHPDGTWSLIAHMAAFFVRAGDQVTRAQSIGVMGRTGGPWGSVAGWFVHAHQEYHLADGTAVDPLDYIVTLTATILKGITMPKIVRVDRGTIALVSDFEGKKFTSTEGGQGFSIGVNTKAYGEVTGLTEDEVSTLVNEANMRGDRFAATVAARVKR
ncbi:murein hydrolase activator EnvC family protein [Plantibacter sp. YIM 135249]|uniref:murein hydrolase activator EnvC family protein n=1 Tax=Plantibacter sp. YIM 135249 TaxID=3423918 RepID=UPI003D331E01